MPTIPVHESIEKENFRLQDKQSYRARRNQKGGGGGKKRKKWKEKILVEEEEEEKEKREKDVEQQKNKIGRMENMLWFL